TLKRPATLGLPRPLAMSYPVPAVYRPALVPVRSLLPEVTSLTAALGLPAAYRAGLTKPARPRVQPWLDSATRDAHRGAPMLVPPVERHPPGAQSPAVQYPE